MPDFNWPQWVFVALYGWQIIWAGVALGEDERLDRFICRLAGAALGMWVLHEGGFW